MTNLSDDIKARPINNIVLPGISCPKRKIEDTSILGKLINIFLGFGNRFFVYNISFTEQLDMGFRWFDLLLSYDSETNEYWISNCACKDTLDRFVNKLLKFLENNQETVILNIIPNWRPRQTETLANDNFVLLKLLPLSNISLDRSDKFPTLVDMTLLGKRVITFYDSSEVNNLCIWPQQCLSPVSRVDTFNSETIISEVCFGLNMGNIFCTDNSIDKEDDQDYQLDFLIDSYRDDIYDLSTIKFDIPTSKIARKIISLNYSI